MAPDRDDRRGLSGDGDPYRSLAALAERGTVLAAAGDLDGLSGLAAEAAGLQARMPAAPPPGAEPSLRRAAAAQARTTALLAAARSAAEAQLGRLAAGRRAAGGYGSGAAAERTVDRAG